ncbi:hypothetical protein GGI10_000935 [Coemansia sp. RSA 2530]|nr:hypothetical protein GGI10_000935 [Coemansia sp. RSA 2530]
MAEAPVSVLESERAATTENARPMMDKRGGRACVRVTNKRNQSYSGGLPLGLDASSGAEADSDLELVCTAPPKRARQGSGPSANRREGRDGRLEADTPGHLETLGQPTQQPSSSDLVWEVSSTSSASLNAPESDIDDDLDSGESVVDEPVCPAFTIQLDYATTSEESVDGMDTFLVTDSAATVSAALLATGETRLVVTDRRSVIRDGLLR